MVFILAVLGCDSNRSSEDQGFPKGPELPNALVPVKTSSGDINSWQGEYTAANNAKLTLSKVKTSTENISGVYLMKMPQLTTYEVTEISGKTIKVH